MIRFVKDREIYEQVIRDRVPLAKKRLWIATADIKDMYVDFGLYPFFSLLKIQPSGTAFAPAKSYTFKQ